MCQGAGSDCYTCSTYTFGMRQQESSVPPFPILLLGPYPPPNGGVQTNLVAIRNYVVERGHRCSVINLTGFHQPDHDGVFFPKSAGSVVKLLFRLPSRIIHIHIGGELSVRLLLLGLFC